jgi:energy-coupling factor transport system permease protein
VIVPAYRERASALHAARAGATAGLCLALGLVCAVHENPVVLLAVIAATVTAGVAAGVGQELRRAALLAVPLALLVTAVNPLVYREGDTLLVRGGELLGRRIDVTLEALAAGGLAGLRVAAFVIVFGLFSACVDPDDLLRMFRRLSYRSALTAVLATRLVPVMARDVLRMGDAARCRPQPPARLAVARAALFGALDRAVDVAAALEVRGYSVGGRPERSSRPWSRQDVRVAAAATLIASTAVVAALAGVGPTEAYPQVEVTFGRPEAVLCALLLVGAMLPFAGRGARLGVARA